MTKPKRKPFIEGTHYKVVKLQTKNKKVINATKVIVDGIEFKSKLEGYIYYRLKELGIDFEYEKTRFTLIYPFTYQDENVRGMTYRPDYVGKTFVLECKGHRTQAWMLREKLAKRRFSKDYPDIKYYIVSSMIGFEDIVEDLLKRETNETVPSNIAA